MSFTPKIWNDNDILSILDLNRLEEAVAEMGNYTPTVWAVGDKITAEKMNKLEQGIAESGETWNTVFEGNVTTTENSDHAQGEINANITADTIKVTFNGTEYTCEKKADGPFTIYGDTTYTEYPFAIVSGKFNWYLSTQTAGTYSLKIEEPQSGGLSDFSTAEVTIINNGNDIVAALPIITNRLGNQFASGIASIYGGETTIFTVMLFKGKAATNLEDFATVTATTGNYADGDITGDCTITIGNSGGSDL